MAVHVAGKLAGDYNGSGGREIVSVAEGSEPGEFWSALGGQGEYATESFEDASRPPRLFQCSNSTGVTRVEEIDQFEQEDLLNDDVMILDVFTQLFVWIGSQANEIEKTRALEFAQHFINNATDGRFSDIPVVRITAGNEPLMFTSYFPSWDENACADVFVDPYQKRLEAEQAKRAAAAPAPVPAAALKHVEKPAAAPAPAPVVASTPAPVVPVAAAASSSATKCSLDSLKSGVPAGVDPSRKEDFLDDAAFQSAIGMSRSDFAALPKWKRDAKKKEIGIF